MKNLFLVSTALITFFLSSCEKEDTKKTDTSNNQNTGDFTPPTNNYWKIDGITNLESNDAGRSNLLGNHFGVSKPFDNTSNYNQLNITFCDTTNIRRMIPEGGYKEFYIAKRRDIPTRGNDSALLQVTSPRNGGYTYFYGTGGTIYISKKNNKLRFSSKSTFNLIGSTNTNINLFNQTGNTEFSWEEL